MAILKPDWENIKRLTVKSTQGELFLLKTLNASLDDSYEIFFNCFLDGDRPDIVIVKKNCGAIIIEVKDWVLTNYKINIKNQWKVNDSIIRSPQAQVFRYKSNMYNLHLPILGLKELENPIFYHVIDVFVYLHGSYNSELSVLYDRPQSEIKAEIDDLNIKRKKAMIDHERYEKSLNFLNKCKNELKRDKYLSYTEESIANLVSKIKNIKKNILFTDDIYTDFIRRLSPPIHMLEQGISIKFDKKQAPLTESANVRLKIKGVAGCGKSTILAQRAINANKRHNGQVLILTYNITLRNYIKDKITQIQFKGIENNIEIINYHAFISNKINEYAIDINNKLEKHTGKNESEIIEKLYKDLSLFNNQTDIEKFKTIFIDEVQDYEPEWIKIIRDNFLEENGEMVLFGDQSQNIYERDATRKESPLVQGFGRWIKLTKSYRSKLDTPLVNLFKQFQQTFLINKYSDAELFESNYVQGSLNFDLLAYDIYGEKLDESLILNTIFRYIKKYNINPNDMAIICSQIEPLIRINSMINKQEKTMTMFENEHEHESNHLTNDEIEKIRRRKKTFFMQNSGLIKLATIHSFKGLESNTIFCILLDDDNPELVYTGITRAQKNLVIFDCTQSKFKKIFETINL